MIIRSLNATKRPSNLLRQTRCCRWTYKTLVRHPQSPLACQIASPRSYSTDEKPKPWTQHSFAAIIEATKDVASLSRPIAPVPKTHTAYIALGSNLGDRISMIETACNKMQELGIKIRRTSSLWETEPMYVLNQERFLNGVCEVCYEILPVSRDPASFDI